MKRKKYLHAAQSPSHFGSMPGLGIQSKNRRHSIVCAAASFALLLTAYGAYAGQGGPLPEPALPAMAVQSQVPSSDAESSPEVSSINSSVSEAAPSSQQAIESESPPPPCPGEYAYQSLYPKMYCPEVVQTEVKKTMYLTFDDGPSDNTARILDILKQKNVKATFFVVGKEGDKPRKMMKRIVDEGNTIAVHTYSHKYEEVYTSVEAYLNDFNKIYNLIYENTGVKPTLFRFPGGSVNSYNKGIRQAVIKEMQRRRFSYFDWNVSCGDGSSKDYSKQELVNNVLSTLDGKERGVVLMHDSNQKDTTVDALPDIIDGLRAQGFLLDKLTNRVLPITM